tara:strand:+ start:54 stop:527 length:474 start_codon:yes stop_codon:yes gene_type:complete
MKEHPKYKGYHGTEDGNIISTKQKTPRVLKPQKHHLGYKLYFLHHDGKQFGITGHRFVAECFLPNLDNLSDVHHIDEDKQNNKVSNLMWASHKQNCDLTGYDHLSKKYVVENVKTGEKTVIFNLSKWCKKNNVSRRSAYRVLNGDRNMTKGFVISKS